MDQSIKSRSNLSSQKLKIKTPIVFARAWKEKARFKGLWGGRGSGKSNDRAQAVIDVMIEEPGVRVACIREVQDSIKDSVHKLISDWIIKLDVAGEFDILDTEIRHRTNGSVCIFKGMQDRNAENIKSMEGVKYCWWEEAQTASDKSIRLLRPTIRMPQSEIWFTWNPRNRTDPVDKLLRQNDLGDNAIIIEAQYTDNPWFPDELEIERQIDLLGDRDNYNHVWLGSYQSQSNMQLISEAHCMIARERTPFSEIDDPMILGVDVARFGDDKSVIYPRRGSDGATMPIEIYSKIDTMALVGRVTDAIGRYHPDAVFIDVGGVGGGVVDRLIQLNYSNVIGVNFGAAADRHIDGVRRCKNKRSQMWETMHEHIKSGLALPYQDWVLTELTGPLYKYDEKNAIVLEKKEDMKKPPRSLKSPDVADALALTYAYPVEAVSIQVQQEQEEIDNYDPFGWDD